MDSNLEAQSYAKRVWAHAFSESWDAVFQTKLKGSITLFIVFAAPHIRSFCEKGWKGVSISDALWNVAMTASLVVGWFLIHLLWISPRKMDAEKTKALSGAAKECEALKTAADERSKKRLIKDRLATLMLQGQGWLIICADVPNIDLKPIEQWENETGEFLQSELGISYLIRFRNRIGLHAVSPMRAVVNLQLWENLYYRTAQLEVILREISA